MAPVRDDAHETMAAGEGNAMRTGRLWLAAAALLLSSCAMSSGAATNGSGTVDRPNTSIAGAVRQVAIPSTDGFSPRRAYVYLPPSALAHPSHRLPVLILLHGTQGAPSNWVNFGKVPETVGAFATQHGGVAPIVVMPDDNGSLTWDSECVKAQNGADIEHYLAVDVPHYVLAHFPATTDRRHWAVAGLSEGGTCALMIALRYYPDFPVVGAFSALKRATINDVDDEAATTQLYFGGSKSAFDEHDPTWLLTHHRYPGLVAAYLFSGVHDKNGMQSLQTLATDARSAGISVTTSTGNGGHHWVLWQAAFVKFVPWLWSHIGS